MITDVREATEGPMRSSRRQHPMPRRGSPAVCGQRTGASCPSSRRVRRRSAPTSSEAQPSDRTSQLPRRRTRTEHDMYAIDSGPCGVGMSSRYGSGPGNQSSNSGNWERSSGDAAPPTETARIRVRPRTASRLAQTSGSAPSSRCSVPPTPPRARRGATSLLRRFQLPREPIVRQPRGLTAPLLLERPASCPSSSSAWRPTKSRAAAQTASGLRGSSPVRVRTPPRLAASQARRPRSRLPLASVQCRHERAHRDPFVAQVLRIDRQRKNSLTRPRQIDCNTGLDPKGPPASSR